MAHSDEKGVAFQVILPTSMLAQVRRLCAQLQINSVGAYIRQLIAADLARENIDAWGSDAVATEGERAAWEASDFGQGHFLLQAVAPPANGYLTVRVRWRRNARRGHTEYLSTPALAEFPDLRSQRVLYLRGGAYGVVETVMGFGGGAHLTLRLTNRHPASAP